jgi:hypothetical protein
MMQKKNLIFNSNAIILQSMQSTLKNKISHII